MGCPGWVQMAQMWPEVGESEAAREGTAAHEIAEALAGIERTAVGPNRRDDYVGKLSETGVAYTDEMYDAASLYADTVGDIMRRTRVFGGPFLRIERRVPVKSVHDKCYGTPDFWLFDANGLELFVVDFKYGFGMVEPFENWQLITYARGVLDELSQTAFDITKVKVNLCVVQPRAYHHEGPVRTWRTDYSTLVPFFESLKTSAHVAMSPAARTNSGPHCRDCQALPVCDSARNAAANAIDHIDSIRIDASDPVSQSAELKALRRAREAVEYRLSALETRISENIKNGVVYPHFELAAGQARTRWNIPVDALTAIGDASGIQLRKTSAVLTPNQAIKAGMPEEIVQQFVERSSGADKLVKINHNKAREVFA